MDKKIIAPDRRDLFLTVGMVLCGFIFLEGGMIDPEAALGKAVFIAAACAASVLYLHAEGIRQNRGSMWVLASIIVLSLPFVLFSGCTEHIITMLALIPMCFYWIACSCGQTAGILPGPRLPRRLRSLRSSTPPRTTALIPTGS